MTDPMMKYENNARAAHAVGELLEVKDNFTLRPFNRFAPAFTDWWLVPTTKWPAYGHGKLCFHRRDGVMYTGYYAEKGLGNRLSGMQGVAAKHIMRLDWRWYSFVEWVLGGKVEDAIADVLTRSETKLRVRIEAYAFNQVPNLDQTPAGPSDLLEFEIGSPEVPLRVREVISGGSTLGKFGKVDNIRDLVHRIGEDRGLDFFWLGWTLGIRLQYWDGSSEGWGARDIWNKALAPWEKFAV